MDRTTTSDRDLVGGLQNGLAVIEAFDDTRPRLSISDVAQVTGLTRAAARRYLLTLTHLGYAEHDGKYFSLTPRVLRLGYAFLSSLTLPTRVQPFLERIAEELGESSSAAVLDDGDVVYVGRAATRRIMSVGLAVGSRLPAYCTSLGRALLAHRDAAWLDAYLARTERRAMTPRTVTAPADLLALLEGVRASGYSLVDEELELGLRSIAVPVIDGRGRVACAINVGVQAARVPVADMTDRILPVLRRAAEDLRRVL
ncbi:IclR family transcriptional regulator C-terminal domain-containing protein [uncultured Alsobacter sp.]|uniref:IclR family transcriptional regulator domain-containing protein n=1 Tax=uncultured Alsobacter sp. TaxID=1748258 RepID=UPI0025F04E1D|nr:IclR family transcriptional regulator C-terminal domain-containing protein [uncultured Alsobacter sp.]